MGPVRNVREYIQKRNKLFVKYLLNAKTCPLALLDNISCALFQRT
jgi:hypothetical protein